MIHEEHNLPYNLLGVRKVAIAGSPRVKIKQILAALLVMAFTAPAAFSLDTGDFNLDAVRAVPSDIGVPLPQKPQAVNPVPVNPAAPAWQKEWTVMDFMNGTNNLSEYFFNDVKKMSAIGTTANVNLVTEFSIQTGQSSLVQRMRLLPSPGGEINGEVYKTWQNRDMGDWRNAAEFVKWAKAAFPAKRYLLIIQDHGGGFIDESWKPKTGDKGISYDDVTNNYIKVPELSKLLTETGPVDLFIMNACEMQMAEVAYEIGGKAGVIIASEETDDAKYFQYKERLEYLGANSQAPTETIASAFIDMRRKMLAEGNQFYSEVQKSTFTIGKYSANTLSAIRTAQLNNLPAALDEWSGAVIAANEPDAVLFAVASAVRLGVQNPAGQPFSQFTDLGDFANRLAYASKKQEVKDATTKLLGFIKKLVLANGAQNFNASGVDYAKAIRGVSIKMIPLAPVSHSVMNPGLDFTTDTKYADLRLAKDSQWDEFLAQVPQ